MNPRNASQRMDIGDLVSPDGLPDRPDGLDNCAYDVRLPAPNILRAIHSGATKTGIGLGRNAGLLPSMK
jgi:hypothetical protein